MRIDLSFYNDYNRQLMRRNWSLSSWVKSYGSGNEHAIYCRVCPSCGVEFYNQFYHTSLTYTRLCQELSRIPYMDAETAKETKDNYLAFLDNICDCANTVIEMRTCSICGGTMPDFSLHNGFSHDEDGYILTDSAKDSSANTVPRAFEKLRELRLETYRRNAETRLQKIGEDGAAVQAVLDAECGETIREDKKMLGKYISHVLNIEASIYATEKRLQELYVMEGIVNFDSLTYKGEHLSKVNQELEEATDAYHDICETDVSSLVKVGEIEVGPKPIEPSKPARFSAREPHEPRYETPGLFNKKKVLSENEARKNRYHQELASFESAKAEHAEKIQKYEQQLAQYQKEHAEYMAKFNEEKARVEREYQANLAKEKDRLSTEIEDAKLLVEQKQQELNEIRSAPVQSAGVTIVREEIATAEKTLIDLMQCRSRLYAQNVIYPKYRNLVAVASFNDYIMSGRCSSLEGANGAYDKYEFECRADMIISKLTDVLSSLEQIKDNQYMLYTQISEVNRGLNKLNETMEKAVKTLQTISADTSAISAATSSISAHTAQIAESNEVIAYNTAATAFYAKKNAELTNALGFLIALK